MMATVKKQAKKENANPHDSFAAVQLLNDPQVCHPMTQEFSRVVCEPPLQILALPCVLANDAAPSLQPQRAQLLIRSHLDYHAAD